MIRTVQIFLAVALLASGFVTSAIAEWRQEVGIFRVGVVTQQDGARTIEHYEPFKKALSRALEMDVEIFPVKTENSIIQALAADRIEYAILSASGYALSSVLCECVEPLVTARTSDSGDAYHTVIITRISGISDVADLSNAKIGALAQQSISGHPYAKFLLSHEENVRVDAPQSPFITYPQGIETLKAFQKGELDAVIGWSSMSGDPTEGYSAGTLKQLASLNEGDATDYRILWHSPPLPYRPHAISKKLNGEAKTILRMTLEALYDRSPIAYDVIEPNYGGGFIVSRQNLFEPLIEFVKSLYKPAPEKIVPSAETVGSVEE